MCRDMQMRTCACACPPLGCLCEPAQRLFCLSCLCLRLCGGSRYDLYVASANKTGSQSALKRLARLPARALMGIPTRRLFVYDKRVPEGEEDKEPPVNLRPRPGGPAPRP